VELNRARRYLPPTLADLLPGMLTRQGGPAQETSFANAGLVAPGHSLTWASPRAPRILLKSLFRADQALQLKPK
jgi:D-amino-acid dehydrogenase